MHFLRIVDTVTHDAAEHQLVRLARCVPAPKAVVCGSALLSDEDIRANNKVGAYLFAFYRDRLLCGDSSFRLS